MAAEQERLINNCWSKNEQILVKIQKCGRINQAVVQYKRTSKYSLKLEVTVIACGLSLMAWHKSFNASLI
jgi:hypothetical protein